MLIVRLLTFVGVALIFSSRLGRPLPKQRQQNQLCNKANTFKNDPAHAGQEHPIRLLAPSPNSAKQTEEREHRRAEQQYWKWSIALTGFAVLVTLTGIFVAGAALNASWRAVDEAHNQVSAAQYQLTAMRDGQRAWLKITSTKEVAISGDIRLSVLWFSAKMIYKNIGQTTAQYVSFNPHIYVECAPSPLPKSTCKNDKLQADNSGEVVFPQDSGGGDWTGIQIPISDLVTQAGHIHKINATTSAYLEMIGCLTYGYAGSAEMHVTGFIGDLNYKTPGRPSDRQALTVDALLAGQRTDISMKLRQTESVAD